MEVSQVVDIINQIRNERLRRKFVLRPEGVAPVVYIAQNCGTVVVGNVSSVPPFFPTVNRGSLDQMHRITLFYFKERTYVY